MILMVLLLLFSGYGVEWQFPVRNGWVTMAPDVNGDSVPELLVQYGNERSDSLVFISGVTRQRFWSIPNPYAGYTSWSVIAAVNMDGDGNAELVVHGYQYSYPHYSARFRIYDCTSRTVEFESPEFSSYQFPYPFVADIDGDHRAELIISYGDTLSITCLVYGWSGSGLGGYEVRTPLVISAQPVPALHRVFIPAVKGYPVIIRDAAGRVIRTLTAEQEFLFWDGIDSKGQPVVPGVYFYDNGVARGKIELMQ
ncbi:MAG: hypothetical protein ABIK51_00275 [candidate division WOR-3 bacterium]